ncbi:MAG: TonB-dependent receptor [Gammaproteobacteria bacterium]
MIKSLLKYTISLSLFLSSTISLAQVALEEMVVTSQKREQNLLDVPSALQAFSGDMLEGAGVRDTDDLVSMIPDMMMSGEDAGRANIWLRGIGSTKFDIGSEGSNAFFVDEIYMSRNQSILTGLVDLERIEVLKGPQGTLYGKNALGGAVSIFYKKPTSETEQRIKVGAGDNGQEKLSYLLSGQLSEGLYGRMILSYQDDDGVHRDNTFPGDTGPKNENVRVSFFGEGNNYEWSLSADSSVSEDDAMVSEAIICPRGDTVACTASQRTLIQPSLAAAAGGLDIFVTNFATSSAYAASGGDAAALTQIRSDRFSSNLSEDTFGRREDTMLSAKFKSFRDDYDFTVLVSTNQNQGEELKDFDSTKAKSFVQGSDQTTNQSSLELRWNSKPEDQIQWVAGIYSFLDYGDRTDIFRTGPDSVFNQKAVAATAYIDKAASGNLFNVANLANIAPAAMATYTGPAATKTALASTYKVATGGLTTSYLDYGTAQLDLSINNKSSAAFAQVTIPMADRWNITLGARYTYDVKGMVYTTSSNSTGVPDALVLPGCTSSTINPDGSVGCSDFNALNPTSLYTATQYAGQLSVIAGAYAAAPSLALAPGWDAACQVATSTAGSAACMTNFSIIAAAQGVGVAPIASAAQVFTVEKEASWTSTDPKMTIDFKPNDNSLLWYTFSTGFKGGGWQFATYFKDIVEQGFDPEELEMNEIGYKGSFLNGSLNLSTVAYSYDWTNKQVIKVAVVQGLPLGLTRNAGESTINGFDLNLTARVADQTTLNFNYSYIDAQYDVYCDDSRNWTEVHGTFTTCKTGVPGAYSRAGGGMPWTPDNAMVLSFEHVEPTRIGDVIISSSYSYKTNVANADERVAGLTFLDEIARLNFSTTIEFNNGTSLRGYCTNCLDVDDDIGFTLIYPGGQGGGARVKYYEGMRAGLEVVHRF